MLWLSRHRPIALAAICLFWTGLIFLGRTFPHVPFLFAPWSGEQDFEDLLRQQGRKTPAREDFVFIGIDQQSAQLDAVGHDEIGDNRALQLMTERPFPWSREVWALLLDRLFASGARLVVFDLIFNPPNEGDPAFHEALDKYRDRVVIGANFDASRANQLVLPNSVLIPAPQQQDDRVGFVNFWGDASDGKVRGARFAISESQLADVAPFPGEEMFRSLVARALTKLGRAQDVPADVAVHPIRFGPTGAYEPRNLYEVFFPPTWHAQFSDGAFFKDKIVMVGASAQVLHDVVNTPAGPATHGPALHLHTLAAALAHQFITPTPLIPGCLLVGSAGVLAWCVIALIRRPLVSVLALLGMTVAYLFAARIAYDAAGFLLLTVPVLTVFLLSGSMSLGLEYVLERLEKLRTRRTLERYVSKNLVKEIMENPESFYSSLRGIRLPATILFSDIVGFTTMTESADPEALVKQLNEYLSRMTRAVFRHGGTLDKFIGDAVMAVWGNVSSRGKAEDAKACAQSALTMRRELKELNAEWAADGVPPFAIGIGINHGDVLVGNIGSQEKADPTVIGDAVNLASRLEALTRVYKVDILVGERAADLIRDAFHLRSVARVQVRGRADPVHTFALIGAHSDAIDQQFLQWLETYEQGIEKFRGREFKEAQILLSRFLEFYPDDLLAKMYLQRALEYESVPPDQAWNAVEVFESKK
jgi:adenylate cyclase